MAAETGIPSVYLEHQLSHGRAAKKTQGSIIDKIRHKPAQSRSWSDSIQSVCGSITERKTQSTTLEPDSVRGCLDTLQKAMKVISLQTMKERLELIGRQLGLSTKIQDQKISLGTDVFHVDVLMGENGLVSSVKLVNQGDVAESPDLKDVLRKGDFKEFTEHLQGLQSIYDVTNDEKLKSKAFLALQALEKDLNQLAQFQNSISGVANYIHKCPLGIMLPRLAGKPMKLIYFVSPYDLLDKKTLTAHPLTVEAITENFLGQSVNVCIEPVPDSHPANKLQTMPLMNVSKTQDGKTLPSFSAKSSINSMMLPASFVLVLPQSIPISTQILQKITASTQLEIYKDAPKQELLSLILSSFSNDKVKDGKELHVSLPDQQHTYFLDGFSDGTCDQLGVMVSRIPFTHPTHVPQILNLMRQQLLFNIIISSFIRHGSLKESQTSVVFEVTAVSLQQLTIVFEHPAYDSMVTVDVDLTDITNLKCSVTCSNTDQSLCSDEEISRVFQRCMSIPIMLRWLICKGRSQLDKMKEAALAAERERQEKAQFLKQLHQSQTKIQHTVLPTKGRPPPQPPHPPPLPPPPSYTHAHHSSTYIAQGHGNGGSDLGMIPSNLTDPRIITSGLNDFRNMTESNGQLSNDGMSISSEAEKAHNPLLTTLLDGKTIKKGQGEVHDSPMLSLLLDDNTSVATTVTPMTAKPSSRGQNKREKKRKAQSDLVGPSSKHRFNDNDRINSPSDRLGSVGGSIDPDTVPNLIDQSLPCSPSIMSSMPPAQGIPGHHQHHLHQQQPQQHHQLQQHPQHLQQHHQHVISNHAKAPRTSGNVIDLTEDVGESNLKKLADSVEHLMHKDTKSEQDISALLNDTEAQSRIPSILQNSPSGSKNDHASTSLEDFLKGSGEVGRAKDFDPSDAAFPQSGATYSKLSSLLLASADSPSSVHSAPPHKANTYFFSDKAVGNMKSTLLTQDNKPNVRKGQLRQSASMELPDEMQQGISGIFDKFETPRIHKTFSLSSSDEKIPISEGKVSLKLKVLKQQNNVKQVAKLSNLNIETKEVHRKANNIGTFDFKSDEDDDDSLAFPERSIYTPPSMTNSSHRQKQVESSVSKKAEKVRKKDKSSGNNAKRKRDKEESKREKKRKKTEHHIQDSMYRTVGNDGKADIKLKIKVISDKSDNFSDGSIQSYEISKKPSPPALDKEIPPKLDFKETVVVSDSNKEKDVLKSGGYNVSKNLISKSMSGSHKNLSKSVSGKGSASGNFSNKTDPKLVTKATIRLKPLNMPNSGSTVNVSQSVKTSSLSSNTLVKSDRKVSTSTAASSSDKRVSSTSSSLERKGSSSNLTDRKNSTQASSVSVSSSTSSHTMSAPVTSTSSNLSLSSILPNAPNISRIASLPRIPKLSSSSSNTSINRTSSLESVDTKTSSSYNTGPAGRPNQTVACVGVSSNAMGNRPTANTNTSFSYNRPVGQNSTVGGSMRHNFNSRMMGPAHRQGSPIGSTGPSNFTRLPGPRAHNSSGSYASGSNVNKVSNSTSPFTAKGNSGSTNHSSPSISQRTFANSNKKQSNLSKSNVVPKSILVGSSNNLAGQRHVPQNAHGSSVVRTPLSSSSNITRSPNSSSVTKSPSSGKSPNISSNSGRSPSLTSSSRSPSLSNPNRSPNINKSPNINSSTSIKSSSPNMNSNRSPNINSSKSPSTSSNLNRVSCSSSPTGKPVNSLNKVSSSSSKTSTHVNKSTAENTSKSQPIYVPQRAMSSSLKSPQVKSGPKLSLTLSSTTTEQTSSVKTSPSISLSIASNISKASSINTYSNQLSQVHTTSNTCTSQPSTTCSANSSSTVSIVSMSNKQPQQALALGSMVGSGQVITSDTPNGISSEKSSCASNPTTPMSADGAKKFSFPASRGRKNSCSLSAIVDKLHNKTGGNSLDSTLSLLSHCDSSANKLVCGVDKQKQSSQGSVNQCAESTSIKESKISSPKQSGSVFPPAVNSITDEKPKSPLEKSIVKNVPSGIECKKDVKGDPITTVVEDLRKERDKAAANTHPTLSPPFLLSKQSPMSSQSFNVPFQLEQAPGLVHNLSQAAAQIPGPVKAILNSDKQLFKIPSAKTLGESQDEEGDKVFEDKGTASGSKVSKVEVSHASKQGEAHEVKHGADKLISGIDKRTADATKQSSLASPLSDISSPENGLVIDDEGSPLRLSRGPGDGNLGASASKLVSVQQALKPDPISASGQISKGEAASPQSSLDVVPSLTSPKINKPTIAKSPAFSKTLSGASTPKGSDSPCEIDDDLMDEALGFGS